MNEQNLFIRNLVVLLDFVVLNSILIPYAWYQGEMDAQEMRDVNLMFVILCANAALIIAQVFFSTIVHRHYRSVDAIIRQCTYLMLTFGISFYLLLKTSLYLPWSSHPFITFTFQVFIYIALATFVVRSIEYFAIRRLRRAGWNKRKVIFIGNASPILYAYNTLNAFTYTELQVLGYYSDEVIQNPDPNLQRLGSIADALRIVKNKEERKVDEVFCALPAQEQDTILPLMDYAVHNAIQFNYIPAFSSNFGKYLQPRIASNLVVYSNLNEPLLRLGNRVLKRTFDIVVSGFIVLFLLPFIPLIGLCIKLSSPGPVFFKQLRTGLNGHEFYMLKFRSMHVNADADRLQATKDDPRKFAFGNFIRRTNIDELPQFINVLRGDMSIVGPRPHMLRHTEEYSARIYDYMMRHVVRPGITGWAQITGYRGETAELWQMEGRVQRDIWYIQHWTFWLDIRIIFRTFAQFFIHDKMAY